MKNYVKLGSIAKTFSGGTPSRAKPHYFGGTIPWIKSGEVNQRYINSVSEFITDEGLKNSSAKIVQPGTILVAMYGATAGVIAVSRIEGAINQAILAVNAREGVSQEFLFYALEYALEKTVKHVQGAQPNLSAEIIKASKIWLPPLAEQQRIATILDACDRAIDGTAKLLEKQEKRKQGIVHLILKSSTTKPDWSEAKLKDVATVIMGQSPSSSSYNTDNVGLPLIQGNADIKGRHTAPKIFTNAPTKRCVVGDIIMTVRAPVGAIAKSLHDGCLGRGVCAIRANNHIDSEYLYQVLLAKETEWTKVEQGSTFTAISGNDVKNTIIPLPKSEADQRHIAATLALCDKEIKLLRQQHKLLQQQKKGLMQRLLTGQAFTQ